MLEMCEKISIVFKACLAFHTGLSCTASPSRGLTCWSRFDIAYAARTDLASD
jgi:hypothetical protein